MALRLGVARGDFIWQSLNPVATPDGEKHLFAFTVPGSDGLKAVGCDCDGNRVELGLTRHPATGDFVMAEGIVTETVVCLEREWPRYIVMNSPCNVSNGGTNYALGSMVVDSSSVHSQPFLTTFVHSETISSPQYRLEFANCVGQGTRGNVFYGLRNCDGAPGFRNMLLFSNLQSTTGSPDPNVFVVRNLTAPAITTFVVDGIVSNPVSVSWSTVLNDLPPVDAFEFSMPGVGTGVVADAIEIENGTVSDEHCPINQTVIGDPDLGGPVISTIITPSQLAFFAGPNAAEFHSDDGLFVVDITWTWSPVC